MHLKEEIDFKTVKDKLKEAQLQNIYKKIEKEICVEVPNAHWERKKHMVQSPDESDFKEN